MLHNSLHIQHNKVRHLQPVYGRVPLWLAHTTTVTRVGNDLRGAPNHVDQLDQVSQSLAVGLPSWWACTQHSVREKGKRKDYTTYAVAWFMGNKCVKDCPLPSPGRVLYIAHVHMQEA